MNLDFLELLSSYRHLIAFPTLSGPIRSLGNSILIPEKCKEKLRNWPGPGQTAQDINMIHSSLAIDSDSGDRADSWHDRVQIGLAIADEMALKSLLLNATPPLIQSHRLGGVRSAVGVPIASTLTVDATLEFEELHCVLAVPEELEQHIADYSRRKGNQRGYLDLIRCEADTKTLGQFLSLANAIALLNQAGFSAEQSQHILNLPQDGWDKSWWYQADALGEFTIPFLRLIRTRRHPDGTITLQYKDFFAQQQPVCFKSCTRKLLIEILSPIHEFAEVIAKINRVRQQSGLSEALLICDQISDLEARAFISQNISLYASHEIALPVWASCVTCSTPSCPLRGRTDSPVLLCRQFCLSAG